MRKKKRAKEWKGNNRSYLLKKKESERKKTNCKHKSRKHNEI